MAVTDGAATNPKNTKNGLLDPDAAPDGEHTLSNRGLRAFDDTSDSRWVQ